MEEFIESGQFEFLTKSESYLKDGYFDPDKMINLLKNAQDEALDAGFTGLRVAGEMTWFFSDMPGVEGLMEYESKLNEFLPDSKVVAVCQYNEEKFPPEILVDVFRTHPRVLIYDDLHESPYYMPPRIFAAQLKGEVTGEHYESMKEDIIKRTQWKRREKEAEKTYQEVFNKVADAITIHDPETGEIVDANKPACKLWGYPEEEFIGLNVGEIAHTEPPYTEERAEELIKKASREEPQIFEWKDKKKDGTTFWVEVSLRLAEIGGKERVIAAVRDITERRKVEEKFKKLFRASPDPTYFIDETGVFREVNVAGIEVLGYKKDEIVGKSLSEVPFFPPETKRKIMKNFERRLNGEKISPYNIKAKSKDGEILIAEINSALLGEKETPVGIIGIARNITEQRKAEERKDFLNTLLKQDLGSKYQTIQGYLQLLEEADLSGESRRYLRKAVKAGREADEILVLAKELEEIEEVEWIAEKNIVKVLEHVADGISKLAKRENVEIDKNYPERVVKVKGDYSLNTLFSQILKIRIQNTESDKIKIDIEEKEENVLLRIEDNGAPLVNEIKNLFSGELYTGETAGARGVRYYMVRQIAEHNNAEIEVKDSDLGGARFDFYLERA